MYSIGRKKHIINYESLIILLVPFLFVLLYKLITNQNYFSIQPFLSDEIDYWREMFSFDNCGFSFGKTGWLGAKEAVIGPFGCHGWSTILCYWWFSILFSWQKNSIIICNLLIYIFSLIVLCFCLKPNKKQALVFFLFSFSYLPFVLYFSTSLIETYLYSLVIIQFSLFVEYKHHPNKVTLSLNICFGIYISAIRIVYIVVLLPLIFDLILSSKKTKKVVGIILTFILAAFSIYVLYKLTCAQYPFGYDSSDDGFIVNTINNTYLNIYRFFSTGNNYFENLQHYFIVIVSLFLFVFSFNIKSGKLAINYYYLCLFCIILFTVSANIILYDIGKWRDYRVIAPVIYFVLLFLIFKESTYSKAKKLLFPLLLVLCFFSIKNLGYFNNEYSYSDNKFKVDLSDIVSNENQIAMSLNLFNSNYSMDICSSLDPKYGLLLYEDEEIVKEETPHIVINKTGINYDDRYHLYKHINDIYIYIYNY